LRLIVGLGNPGKQFALTRHNIGFRVVKAFTHQNNLPRWQRRSKSKYIRLDDLLLLLPQAFMNLSGVPVAHVVREFHVRPEDILVVHDDVDIAFGEIRFKENGSSAGHKGLISIISQLKENGFARLRFGIGKIPGMPTEEYVLEPFLPEEEEKLPELIEHAASGIKLWLESGIEACMNSFNRRKLLLD